MIIDVKVVTNAKQNSVKKEQDRYKVYLTVSPIQGKANKMLLKMVSDHFKIKRADVKITRGIFSSNKALEIVDKK